MIGLARFSESSRPIVTLLLMIVWPLLATSSWQLVVVVNTNEPEESLLIARNRKGERGRENNERGSTERLERRVVLPELDMLASRCSSEGSGELTTTKSTAVKQLRQDAVTATVRFCPKITCCAPIACTNTPENLKNMECISIFNK